MVAGVDHPFPVGTRVRCINNDRNNSKIEVGEEYTVTHVYTGLDYTQTDIRGVFPCVSMVRLDDALTGGFFHWRFELADPPKPDVSWWDKEGIEDA